MSGPAMFMSVKKIKWVIFSVMLVLFPACFYLYFDFAIWTALYALISKVSMPLARGHFPGSLIFVLINCAFWIGIYYFASKRIAQKIAAQEGRGRFALTATFLIVLVLISLFPVYDGGLNLKEGVSAFSLYRQLF